MTPKADMSAQLRERLERCAESCDMYSPDQCATIVDGIGHLALRVLFREASHALATTNHGAPVEWPAAAQYVDTGDYWSAHAGIGHVASRLSERDVEVWDCCRAECIAAHKAAAPVDNWQPIETAPRDRAIFAWNGDYLTIATWNKTLGDWVDQCELSGFAGFSDYPTHWQPLPPAPASKEASL